MNMKKKILIIDDEGDLVEMLVLRLMKMDYLVDVALSGQVGIDKAISFEPDLILLDVVMPAMDGWEVCRRLRAHPKTEKTPIVITTAFDTLDLKRRAETAGANRVLLKPFDLDMIQDLM